MRCRWKLRGRKTGLLREMETPESLGLWNMWRPTGPKIVTGMHKDLWLWWFFAQ